MAASKGQNAVKRWQMPAYIPLVMSIWLLVSLIHSSYWSHESLAQRSTSVMKPYYNQTLSSNHRQVSARDIVVASYNSTYATMVEGCLPGQGFLACVRKTKQLSSNFSWPWWFHTLIRDSLPNEIGASPLFGFWHNLTFVSPRINFCAIEKIGTKHWRNVQCRMNKPGERYVGLPCQANTLTASANASSVVFLRDPLERFLSAFLDKCKSPTNRMMEPHCEPSEVFRESETLTKGIIDDKKTFFETYVDTMPLKWNMHFFPQSLYCDGLFRHINNYDFVGHMGKDFYDNIHELGMEFPDTRLSVELDKVFHFKSKLVKGTGNIHVGVETSASSHVLEYYTPRTLRRVLEYVSIDYVTLGIPIPEWAEQMMQEGQQK